ncbi:MAG: class I SAM-dependent methyltransferase [Chloroflexi bacterium]|nr:class I SAM-dependent methyltransferase [Chloroflexota bacterium]
MELVTYYDDYWSDKDDSIDVNRLALIARHVKPNEKVLEVDCSTGVLAKMMQDNGAEVAGTDISNVAVERTRKKGVQAVQVDLDTDTLPFADDTFDAVISDSGVEHLFFSQKAVAECIRVLKPDGRFILNLPNIGHWRYRIWLLFGRFPYIKDSPTDETHLRFFTLYEAKRMCESLGVRVESVDGSASLWVRGFYPSFLRRRVAQNVYTWATHKMPSILARDFILICKKRRNGRQSN